MVWIFLWVPVPFMKINGSVLISWEEFRAWKKRTGLGKDRHRTSSLPEENHEIPSVPVYRVALNNSKFREVLDELPF